ncbi:MAG: anaerobic ribonucleoside triphosphate reductase [Mollicutes bacterium]|nr:anaerobic ribonucleoside triphosphate reductase [Mollicutes bacterium]
MEKDFLDDIVVVKRSGQRVSFNDAKIALAVKKGFDSVYEEYDEKNVYKVKEKVLDQIRKEYKDRKTIGVEDVSDVIEEVLKKLKYNEVYDSFKNYRERRDASREAFVVKQQHKFVKAIESLGLKSAGEENAKRENANVDGDGPMGTMLHFGSTVSREFAKAYLMDTKYSRAHDEGAIHIHDLDFWAMGTTTCMQIDLNKLFKNGFSTGHGYLRTPNSIGSYSALAAIAIQANQNEQHGGQSIPAFDYYMAPGVLKTFKKEFKQAIYNYLEFEGFKELINFNKVTDIIDKLDSIEIDLELFDEFTSKSTRLKEIFESAYENAMKRTDRATYQAMEAFIHNLNTMHSRAGAQVPFSSINFGTDTSPEGRMVIKNYLLATESGLGHGETPIFPISIFKVKEGINYFKEDKNYDLFRLACRVSAKRLFPNFSFIDAPYNKKYYVEGDYNTEVGYMGCRTRVLANVCGPSVTPGRGNLSFTSINLPRLGIKHGIALGERDKADMKAFYKELDETMDLVKGQLLQRFECQCSKSRANFKFLLGSGVWLNSEKMDSTTKLRTVLKHGTLSIGFIGLAETLKALIGEHHGESEKAQKLGLEIIGHMRKKCDEYTEEYNLNFTCLATPAEGLSGRFVAIDRSIYGKIKGVTDRDYYTNSFHVPVYYKTSVQHKLEVEGKYHSLTNAGHISYIELDGDTVNNVDAFETVVRIMHDTGVGYGAINHPVDRDPVCGYVGVIKDVCPGCGRHENEGIEMEKISCLDCYGSCSSFTK